MRPRSLILLIGSLLSYLRTLFVIALGNFIFPFVHTLFYLLTRDLIDPTLTKGHHEHCFDCVDCERPILHKWRFCPSLEQCTYPHINIVCTKPLTTHPRDILYSTYPSSVSYSQPSGLVNKTGINKTNNLSKENTSITTNTSVTIPKTGLRSILLSTQDRCFRYLRSVLLLLPLPQRLQCENLSRL